MKSGKLFPPHDTADFAVQRTGVVKEQPLFGIDIVVAFRQHSGVTGGAAEEDEERTAYRTVRDRNRPHIRREASLLAEACR